MILPDVNVLVYAYRADLDQNEVFRPWLEAALDGTEPIGLADVILTGFLRVVTNRKAFANAATIQAAMSFVEEVRSAPPCQPVLPTNATWRQFATLVDRDPYIVSNRVPDAWIASLAMTSGARVATADAGFARFQGLSWFNPELAD